MKKKYIVTLLLLVLVLAVVYKLSANKKKINEKNNQQTATQVRIPVKVATAEQQTLEISIVKTGNVAPFKEVKALSLTSGSIKTVKFELGDHVNQGQVLAITDDRSLQLDLQKAESNAAKLKNDLNTYTQLLEGKAATQEKVNQVRQDYENAVSEVNHIKRNITDLVVKAPTSGIISVKSVEQGVFVSGGAEIATIVNLSRAKIQVNVTEAEVYQLKKGQQVRITTEVFPGKEFSGTISFISPQADQLHNYMVEIMVGNAESTLLRSGTFVYADFSRKTKQQALVIPREALTGSVQDATVYVVVNNTVHKKTIQTGSEIGGKIQVTSGLNAGDIVVTSGQINLKEGTAISVSK